MTILDRYLGKRTLAALGKSILALVFLFILIDLLTNRREDIIDYDVPWSVVLKYYVAYIPTILTQYQVAALAMLVSALLVLGNAAQQSEITAALAGGVSLHKLVRMPVLIAACLAVLMFVTEETIGTKAAREAERLDTHYFSRSKTDHRGPAGWANLSNDWMCHIMKFNRVALTGENVFMHSIRKDAVEQLQAKRIFWDAEAGQWLLEDGRWFVFPPKEEVQLEVKRITQSVAPITETPAELFALEQPASGKTVGELSRDIERARLQGRPTQGHVADWHAKFAQPALSFVMIWLAIPFAMRLRRGGLAIGFGVSIAIGLAYMLLFRVGMVLGHIEHLPPLVAAWLANAVFLILGIFLFRENAA